MSAQSDPESDTPTSVTVRYPKSPYHRVIHVDGAIGGPLPSGPGIQITFYSERFGVADASNHAVKDGAMIAEPTSLEPAIPGVVRELEVVTIMGLHTALALRNWLSRTIDPILESIKSESQAAERGHPS
jgi:hypothetical protein